MAISASSDKIRLARRAVELIPDFGFTADAFRSASLSESHGVQDWRELFPGGLTEALWFISEVSDASMAREFVEAPAPDISFVIEERFAQNVALKPFVRRVMLYDFLHPRQAVARMQRTARVMYGCIDRHRPGIGRIIALNIFYTALVMLWLADRSPYDRLTQRATKLLRRL